MVVFDPGSETEATAAGAVRRDRRRHRARLLRPVYQPIVELATGATLGYEGLIRPVPPAPYADPASLFSAAEESGHVVALDFACVEAIVAGAASCPRTFLSVNLSPRTIEAPEFSAAAMLSILARHDFAPERLVIELTEHQPIADLERVRHKLETCRGAGMRLAADDLGAGNSGLRLLSDLRFDIVKVDLGLVQRSSPERSSSAVVESIVAFAARTGAPVIGEGVEHEEQVEQLTALGVTAAQGYLFSRPGRSPTGPPRGRAVGHRPPAAPPEPRARRGRHRRLAPVDRPAQPPDAQARSARSSASASVTSAGASPGSSPAAIHTIRGSRRNQVSWRLAYCRVRRAVTSIACSSLHSPARWRAASP